MRSERIKVGLWMAILGMAYLFQGCATSGQVDGLQDQLGTLRKEIREAQTENQRNAASLDEHLMMVNQDIDHLRRLQSDTTHSMESLSRQIEVLSARLEELNHRLSSPRRSSPPPAGRPPDQEEVTSGDVADGDPDANPALRDQLYQAAYDHFVKGKFDLSIQGFQDFLQQFPAGDLADNAQYWIGECHYSQGRFRDAARAFDQVVQRFGEGDKVPPALLKKAYSQLELGQVEAGRAALRGLIERYPQSEEAKLAEERLRLFESY